MPSVETSLPKTNTWTRPSPKMSTSWRSSLAVLPRSAVSKLTRTASSGPSGLVRAGKSNIRNRAVRATSWFTYMKLFDKKERGRTSDHSIWPVGQLVNTPSET